MFSLQSRRSLAPPPTRRRRPRFCWRSPSRSERPACGAPNLTVRADRSMTAVRNMQTELPGELFAAGEDGGAKAMGHVTEATCLDCGAQFTVSAGGGFRFHRLRCDTCGKTVSVGFEELGQLYRRHLESLPLPAGVDSEERNRYIEKSLAYAPKPDDHVGIETILDPCSCGGRFAFDAPPHCPQCRSAHIEQGRVVEYYD